MFNEVRLIGRLTRDAEKRKAGKGYFLSFTVAVNESYKIKDEWKERTDFIPVEMFATNPENLEKKLKKGNQVLVFGRLRQDRWEDNEGNKKERIKVLANKVSLLKPVEVKVEDEVKADELEDDDVPF